MTEVDTKKRLKYELQIYLDRNGDPAGCSVFVVLDNGAEKEWLHSHGKITPCYGVRRWICNHYSEALATWRGELYAARQAKQHNTKESAS